MNRSLLVASAVLFAACPQPNPMPDGGSMGVTPIVTSISPVSGPLAGNTSVTINGTSFVAGATVAFGGVPATATTFDTDKKLTAITPTGAAVGAVSVTVTNPGGKTSTLANAFTYETNVTRTLREAVLQNPADTTDTSGMAMVMVPVIAHVDVMGSTAGTGQGAGVRVQAGFGTTVGATPTSADFTWVDASYVGDVDGATSGDKARDSYSGTVSLPAPSGAPQVIYFLAARVSIDNGTTWTIADRDGSANGALTTQLARVTVMQASIEWCKLGGEVVAAPPMISLRGSAVGPTIYGQVYKSAITNMSGVGSGIKGALGYGPAGSDPSTWTWTDATFNVDTGGGANDEFQAVLPNPGPGTYKFAFRFNHDDGPWSYCDADGLATNGFTEDQAGTLTVTPIGIDSCKLQFPNALTSYQGRPSDNVYGRVFVQGVTEATGAGVGIEGELGFGTGGDPTVGTWTWTSATFNTDDGSGGDEFQARLTGPMPGAFSYAYRFRASPTGAWTYCDLDGSMNGVQPAQLGVLTGAPFDVSNCLIESTNSVQTRLPGVMTSPYTALVAVPTLTDATGQGTPLTVEFGYGTTGSATSGWTWSAAQYVDDAVTADRYRFSINAPMTPGSYSTAFRVQVGTRPYVYCDLDGSMNGFDAAQAGRLTVTSALIQSCQLMTVSQFNLASGSPLTVTARALIPGVTQNAGAAPNLRVQIGLGPQGDNASSSALWGWQNATFSADVSMQDEFSLTTYPAYTGGRAVSARASLDGASWTYCDLNGSDVNGYEVNQQYDVTVTNHALFDFCNTQAPTMSPVGGNVFGQIYEPDLTPDASTPFIAQLGVGTESEDPGLAWRWSNATFNVLVGNNNEYVGVVPDAGVGSRFAFRFSIDAGVWCYGDLNGSQNGFSGGANVGTVVP
ncbi:MAG: IPT/TIG domain-containing protein [Archangium sp.]